MSNIIDYKCPCCGGSIEFDTQSQNMKCPYCDTEFDVNAMLQNDEALNAEAPDEINWERTDSGEFTDADGMDLYVCNSCGGQIVCDDVTAATSCPYCDSPVVFSGRLKGELRPDLVIPFKLDKEAAKEGFIRHLKGKKLLPKAFKSEAHIEEIKGIYAPFWLFDTDAEAKMRFHATRVRFWSDRNYNYTETRHYALIREGTLGFDNVPVDGSVKLDDDLMDSIEPYDFSTAVDFQTAYLSGFLADKYDVSSEDSVPRANERIKNSTADAFTQTTGGYASVFPERTYIKTISGRVRYALLPVWLMTTEWNGQRYVFAMNGQSGKFVGNLPMDKKAYFKYFGLYFGISTALSMLALFLLSLM
jgi:DNA-directed RNA polymerase subunit RPC12/RpoP